MQQGVNAAGCQLRPHIKTHKMPYFARLQLEAGAAGITCAKVSEAEVMADGGAEDIFLAYPMVGDFRIKRALALSRRVRRLILAVDSLEGAKALSGAAEAAGLTLEVRLEVDTGAQRTGVLQDHAVDLAKAVAALPNLRLTGIYTFKSLVLHGAPTQDNAAAGKEEAQLMYDVAQAIRAAGVAVQDISVGSTPTWRQAAETGLVTEVRPGTYIFGGLDAHPGELRHLRPDRRTALRHGGEHPRPGLRHFGRRHQDLPHGYPSGRGALPLPRLRHPHREGRPAGLEHPAPPHERGARHPHRPER